MGSGTAWKWQLACQPKDIIETLGAQLSKSGLAAFVFPAL